MCCFAQPIVNVSDTNIFARMAGDGWQYLVYQMEFESKEPNAMILPLPVALPSKEKGTVEFISLKENEWFFTGLASGFPLKPTKSRASRAPTNSVDFEDDAQLEVQEVGDFVASFVPTVNDFDRLDPQFRIPKESWDKIPGYDDYGFAVFQLKEKKGHPHPMAFKFRSRHATGEKQQVFFPTVHIHDGEVHAREEFDHMLYLQSPEFDAVCGKYHQEVRHVTDPKTGYVRSKWAAKEFANIRDSQGILDGDGLVHRIEMRGKLPNKDVLAKLDFSGTDTKTSISIPQLGLPVAGAVGAAGFAWLINRRDQLADGRKNES